MEILYKFKVQTSELTTNLKESEDPRSSDIYIGKNQNWISFDIDFNKELNLTLQPLLLGKEVFNDRIEYKLNTLNVLLTDISFDNTEYYYELVSNLNKTLNQLKEETQLVDIIEYNNKFYTNKSFYIYNDNEDYIYTKTVYNPEDFEIVYDHGYILLITTKNISLKLKDNIIDPKVINEFCFHIPTFYLENFKTGFSYRCIESNIKEFNFNAINRKNNFFKYQCIQDTLGISTDHNIHFLNELPSEMLFKTSSHYFKNLKSISYYTIDSEGGILESSEDDYIFKVSKKLDFSKINIISNTYKTEIQEKTPANYFVNSLTEVNENFNDYGITYRHIDKGYPINNYISNKDKNIFLIKSSMKVDERISEISMTETNDYLRQVDYSDSTIYKQLDDIKYYTTPRKI